MSTRSRRSITVSSVLSVLLLASLPSSASGQVSGGGGSGEVLLRLNAGGSTVGSVDGGPDWVGDGGYVVGATATAGGYSTVPFAGTPQGIWTVERWDPPSDPEWGYVIDGLGVAVGTPVRVNLYVADGYSGTSEVGDRVFDVTVEGQTVVGHDSVAAFGDGVGGVLTFDTVYDGALDVSFAHKVENPNLNGLEVLDLSGVGVVPAPSADPLSFGGVEVGTDSSLDLVVVNAD